MSNWANGGGEVCVEKQPRGSRKPPSEEDVSSDCFLKKSPWHPSGLTANAGSAPLPTAVRMGTAIPTKSTSTRKPTWQSDDFHEILPFHKYLPILNQVLNF